MPTSLLKSNHHNPWVFNGILWSISFIILLVSFTKNTPLKIDYIYTSCFLISVIIPCLINLYLLIPEYLKQEKHTVYILLFLLNLILFSQINIWFFEYIIDYIFKEYYFISYHSNIELLSIFTIFLIITSLIKLSEDWFYFNTNENKALKLKNQHINTQLSYLKSQINPHFLFNSLNVIYALAIEKKDETKDAIVQLSDILRYVIYDSNTQYVFIKDEIILIQNYINFQKLRHFSSHSIRFEKTIENPKYTIYPMLLLPLIENGFKHGIENSTETPFLHITISQKIDIFKITIENSYHKKTEQHLNEPSGIGLVNIKENLDIIYPNKHELKYHATSNKFIVSLKLLSNDY